MTSGADRGRSEAMMRREQGITFLGFLMVAALVGFFAVVGIKLFPLYMESMNVWQGMKNVAERPDIQNLSTREIYKYLLRNYEVQDVDFITQDNIARHLKIERARDKGKRLMHMTYESRRPLFGNLDIVLKFDKTIEIPAYRGN
ncbi:MAG: DUF4845 domain-containing protein [Gammaproteobacteria bacterium]|nr:MAG: DUF4845 domain-containing protein [Gammaproteobacteria bacterium]